MQQLKERDQVYHPSFGPGDVESVDGPRCVVRFNLAGRRKVLVNGLRPFTREGVEEVRARPQTETEIKVFVAGSLDGLPVPEQAFHVADLIPARTVTMLSGDGAAGKSLIAMQLAVSTVTSCRWLEMHPAGGKVLYLSAEDDRDVIHRRLVAISNAQGTGLDALADLHVVELAGEDAVLAAPDGRSGVLKPTPLFAQVEQLVEQLKPALVVLDTLADLYGGDENDRAPVRQFVNLLRGWAIRFETSVLLLAHPSLTGMSNGTGTSGSTAWNNSVRSRLYLERVKDDGIEADPDLRRLRVVKANYTRSGAEIRLRWQDGVFVSLDDPASFAAGSTVALANADRTFLDLLDGLAGTGRYVSPHPTSHNFAPTIMARHPNASGITKRGFEMAMQRLFDGRVIEVGRSPGPPSRASDVIVRCR